VVIEKAAALRAMRVARVMFMRCFRCSGGNGIALRRLTVRPPQRTRES
jgi:hypothetical protein